LSCQPLVFADVTAVAYGPVLRLVAIRHPAAEAPGSAFSLKTALIFGTVLALVLIIAAGLQADFGGSGVLLAATVAGLVDTHASAISVATLVAAGKVAP